MSRRELEAIEKAKGHSTEPKSTGHTIFRIKVIRCSTVWCGEVQRSGMHQIECADSASDEQKRTEAFDNKAGKKSFIAHAGSAYTRSQWLRRFSSYMQAQEAMLPVATPVQLGCVCCALERC